MISNDVVLYLLSCLLFIGCFLVIYRGIKRDKRNEKTKFVCVGKLARQKNKNNKNG